MTLQEFKTLLQENGGKSFEIVLPTGDGVPMQFHITEIGRVEKTFFDCGGTLRTRTTCQLQAWVGPDDDHRIQTDKMGRMLERCAEIVPDATLPLELEYEMESGFVSQFPVADFEVSEGAVVLHLGMRHTECLAPELCIVPANVPASKGISLSLSPVESSGACSCGPTGCC